MSSFICQLPFVIDQAIKAGGWGLPGRQGALDQGSGVCQADPAGLQAL